MKTIKIKIKGGMVQSIDNVPENVSIIVVDYDIGDVAFERISEDEDGRACIISHYDSVDNE